MMMDFVKDVKQLCKDCYAEMKGKGFWDGDGDNVPSKIALMHSELSELLEGFRTANPPIEKPITMVSQEGVLYRMTSMEEEVADLQLRLLDFCGRHNIDLGQATLAKKQYNTTRPHKHNKLV